MPRQSIRFQFRRQPRQEKVSAPTLASEEMQNVHLLFKRGKRAEVLIQFSDPVPSPCSLSAQWGDGALYEPEGGRQPHCPRSLFRRRAAQRFVFVGNHRRRCGSLKAVSIGHETLEKLRAQAAFQRGPSAEQDNPFHVGYRPVAPLSKDASGGQVTDCGTAVAPVC